MLVVTRNQRRVQLLSFAATHQAVLSAAVFPSLQTLELMQLEELRLFFQSSSVPLQAADVLFPRLVENVRLNRDTALSLRVINNMVESLGDPQELFGQFTFSVLMTAALRCPVYVFRIVKRMLAQIPYLALDLQELICDQYLDFFATQNAGCFQRLGCSPQQARQIRANVASVLDRCLGGCDYHDVARLSKFLARFKAQSQLFRCVRNYVTFNVSIREQVQEGIRQLKLGQSRLLMRQVDSITVGQPPGGATETDPLSEGWAGSEEL